MLVNVEVDVEEVEEKEEDLDAEEDAEGVVTVESSSSFTYRGALLPSQRQDRESSLPQEKDMGYDGGTEESGT
jgi:hypothetical protein